MMIPATLTASRTFRCCIASGVMLLGFGIVCLIRDRDRREFDYQRQCLTARWQSEDRAKEEALRVQEEQKRHLEEQALQAQRAMETWEEPSNEPFQMPHAAVVQMDFDSFLKVYEQKMRNNSAPTDRAAADYYAMCLEEKNKKQERLLSSPQKRKLRHLRTALKDWTGAYIWFGVVMVGDGTFWCGAEHTCAIYREQMLADIRTALKAMDSHQDAGQAQLQQEWDILQGQIASASPDKVNRIGTGDTAEHRKEFPVALRSMRQQTQALKQAVEALPTSTRPAIAKGIKSIRADVDYDMSDAS